MKKNLFSKKGAFDSLVNVGIGGAANAAADYAMSQIDALATLEDSTKNYIKLGIGILGGSFNNDYVRAAMKGLATVGASDIVKGLLAGDAPATTTSGLKPGTIGRVRPGNRYFRNRGKVAGTTSDFMGC